MAGYRNGERTALYRYFDADANLLYVGVSLSIAQRASQHAASPWGLAVHTIRVEWFDCGTRAAEAEKYAIATEKPNYNVRHNGDLKRQRYAPAEPLISRNNLMLIWSHLVRMLREDHAPNHVDATSLSDVSGYPVSDIEASLNWLDENGKIQFKLLINGVWKIVLKDEHFCPLIDLDAVWHIRRYAEENLEQGVCTLTRNSMKCSSKVDTLHALAQELGGTVSVEPFGFYFHSHPSADGQELGRDLDLACHRLQARVKRKTDLLARRSQVR